MGPLALEPRNGRRGETAVGGTLRLDIGSCLKPNEAEILGVLIEAAKLSKTGTVVRVAGGWVRDKLLGLENEDIDIALDNCMGDDFAATVNTYLKSQGQDEGKVAVIEANPEQSKHLKTARMKLIGVWVDFVNLRTEVYSSESRIPEASLGTAEEDALRRDFTLNALFYNVNERKVEDKTGRGVDDLRDGIIRTPLSPMITFRDDPLRVLRAVRFAARFGFTLHEDLRAAAQNSEIQAALRTKVSRERVGAELCGMITGKMAQPGLALTLLQELGLAPAVYAPPEHLVPPPPAGGVDWAYGAAVARAAARLLAFRSSVSSVTEVIEAEGKVGHPENHRSVKHAPMAAAPAADLANIGETRVEAGATSSGALTASRTDEDGNPSTQGIQEDNTTRGAEDRTSKWVKERSSDRKENVAPATLVRELFLCAALLPLAGLRHKAKKGKLGSAAHSVVAGSLKLKAKEAKNVEDILQLSQSFCTLANGCMASSTGASAADTNIDGTDRKGGATFSRLSVGLAVRQAKELWPTCVDLCCAIDMCEQKHQGQLSPSSPPPPPASTNAMDPPDNRDQATGGAAFTGSVGDGARTDGDDPAANKGVDLQEGSEDRAAIEKYTGLRQAVTNFGLERAWDMVPLARVSEGDELMAELRLPKGPEIGKQMAKQASWQLEHPEGTREQCVAFLRATM